MSFPSKCAHPGTFPVTALLTCAVLLVNAVGCNSCFVGVSNPANNSPTVTTVNGNPLPACLPLPPPTIAVKVVAHLAQACAGCSASLQVTSVHLLLSGMELHPGAAPDENSSEWQELAPNWVQRPQWVDLVEDPASRDVTVL
jgi:hypothetical protein